MDILDISPPPPPPPQWVQDVQSHPVLGPNKPLPVWLAYIFGVIPASLYVLHDVIDARWRPTRYSRRFYNLYTAANVLILLFSFSYFALQIIDNDHKEAAAIYVVLVLNVYANMKITRGNVVHSMLFYLAQSFGLKGPSIPFPWVGELVDRISSQFMDDDIPGDGPRIRVLACMVHSVWCSWFFWRSRQVIYTLRYLHKPNLYIMDLRKYSNMVTVWVWRCLGDEIPMPVEMQQADKNLFFESQMLDEGPEVFNVVDMEQFVLALDRCSAVLVALVHGDQFKAVKQLAIQGQDKQEAEKRSWKLRGFHMRSRKRGGRVRAPQLKWITDKDTDIYEPHKPASKAASESLEFLTGYCAETIWSLQLMVTLLLGHRSADDSEDTEKLGKIVLSGFQLAFRKDMRNQKYLADISRQGANSTLTTLLAYSSLSLFATPWITLKSIWRTLCSSHTAPDSTDAKHGLPVQQHRASAPWGRSASSNNADLARSAGPQTSSSGSWTTSSAGFIRWWRPQFDPEVFSQFCLHSFITRLKVDAVVGPSKQQGALEGPQRSIAFLWDNLERGPDGEALGGPQRSGVPSTEPLSPPNSPLAIIRRDSRALPVEPSAGSMSALPQRLVSTRRPRPVAEAAERSGHLGSAVSRPMSSPTTARSVNPPFSVGTANSAGLFQNVDEAGRRTTDIRPRPAVVAAREHACVLRKHLKKHQEKVGAHDIPPFLAAHVSSAFCVMHYASTGADSQSEQIECFEPKKYDERAKGRLALMGLTDLYRQLAAIRRQHVGDGGIRAAPAADGQPMLSAPEARRVGAACELTLELGGHMLLAMETQPQHRPAPSFEEVLDWVLDPGNVRTARVSAQRRRLLHNFLHFFTADVAPALVDVHPLDDGTNKEHLGIMLALLFSALFSGAQAKAHWRAAHQDVCSTELYTSVAEEPWYMDALLETLTTAGRSSKVASMTPVPAWQRDDVHAMLALYTAVFAASDLLRGVGQEHVFRPQNAPARELRSTWLCTRKPSPGRPAHAGVGGALVMPEEVAETVHFVELPRKSSVERVFREAGFELGTELVGAYRRLMHCLDKNVFGPPTEFLDVKVVHDPAYRGDAESVSPENSANLSTAFPEDFPGDTPRAAHVSANVTAASSAAALADVTGRIDSIPVDTDSQQPQRPALHLPINEKLHDTC